VQITVTDEYYRFGGYYCFVTISIEYVFWGMICGGQLHNWSISGGFKF